MASALMTSSDDTLALTLRKIFLNSQPGECTEEVLRQNSQSLGPLAVSCALADGHGSWKPILNMTHGHFAPEAVHAGVAVRSLSKMIAAAAFLALIARGEFPALHLGAKLGELYPECRGTLLGDATAAQMLTMQTQLDNRLGSTWRAIAGMQDHAGFPSICDEQELDVEQCVVRVICPSYRTRSAANLPPVLRPAILNETRACADESPFCEAWSASGECSTNSAYMLAACPVACAVCTAGEPVIHVCNDTSATCKQWAAGRECVKNPLFMQAECAASCGICVAGAPLTASTYGSRSWWTERGDGDRARVRVMSRQTCRYDNMGYVLLDALVRRATHKSLLRWIIELVAAKVGMSDLLRCVDVRSPMRGGVDGCYAKPKTTAQCVDGKAWDAWRGGAESEAWAPNALFSSAADMTAFLSMLANRGRVGDERVLSDDAVRLMLSDLNYEGFECQGMEAFGMGIGHCDVFAKTWSKCNASEWWGWGGTYGSRVWMWPRRRRGLGGGLVCAALANIPTEDQPTNAQNKTERIAARQHAFAHRVASDVRALFPLQDAETAPELPLP